MPVTFYCHNIRFSLRNKKTISEWIINVIRAEKKQVSDITYIFCDDDYLSKLNLRYLRHKSLTDIITFSYSMKPGSKQPASALSGDIFISIPRVKENAAKYKISFKEQLHRVMIHGVLHLADYSDKTVALKKKMREKESHYLTMLK